MPSRFTINWFHLVGVALVAAYFGAAMADPSTYHLIDYVNLNFHEAGHWIFAWWPHWFMVFMGSGFQVLLPFCLAMYAIWCKRPLLATLCLMWTGQSYVNVSVYIDDALVQQLPLLGGDKDSHDWNYLLWWFGQLRHTHAIAMTVRGIGWLHFFAGLAFGLWKAYEPPPIVQMEDIIVKERPLAQSDTPAFTGPKPVTPTASTPASETPTPAATSTIPPKNIMDI